MGDDRRQAIQTTSLEGCGRNTQHPSTVTAMADDPFRSINFTLPLPQRIEACFRFVTTSREHHGFETYPLQQIELVSFSESSR